ncbi:MAG TPA: ribbon-helix-helix protein, CopG family [Thermoanaerobaculia bacterium]|nr:ribbon-helix-helix protein, CopG family [Thermoanaerobaculia bacterium]
MRLDEETERLLQRLANRAESSKSEVIRVAIETLARQELGANQEGSVYELVSDLLGVAEGGPSDLSEQTGRRLRELLVSRNEIASERSGR